MPIHVWTRVDAGIFHHFHQRWIGAITDALNQGLLPNDYYALAEQQGAGFEPDVPALKARDMSEAEEESSQSSPTSLSTGGNGSAGGDGGVMVADPRVYARTETDLEFYRLKQNVEAIRHVSRDHLIGIAGIVSKGNKSGRRAFEDFVRKAAEFLRRGH